MARISEYPLANNLDGAELLVGVQGVETYSLTVNQIREYANREILTGIITVDLRVSGGDFNSLEDLFNWLNKTPINNAELVVNIGAGIFDVPDAITVNSLSFRNGMVSKIRFQGQGTGNTTLRLNNTNPSRGMLLTHNVQVEFNQLSIANIGADAYVLQSRSSIITTSNVNVTGVTYFASVDSSNLYLTNTNITCSDSGIYLNSLSGLVLNGGTIDGQGIGWAGISISTKSSMIVDNGTVIDNFNIGIWTGDSSTTVLKSHSLTNNTSNYNIPLNQIQGDGGYITDGNLADQGLVTSVAGKSGDVLLEITDIQDLRTELDALNSHVSDTSIHFLTTDVTQTDVGLDRVDNTADNEKNINGGYF
jgi:hypothetical protein